MKALLAGVVGLAVSIGLNVNSGESAPSCGKIEREETVVTRKVAGGPGPSGIEMPGSGCWTFDLRWAGRSDRLRAL